MMTKQENVFPVFPFQCKKRPEKTLMFLFGTWRPVKLVNNKYVCTDDVKFSVQCSWDTELYYN